MKKTINKPWTREEYTLALIVYFDIKRTNGNISKDNPKIIALSNLLNLLDTHPIEYKEPGFREPDGVRRRISYFKSMDEGKTFPDRPFQQQAWIDYQRKI